MDRFDPTLSPATPAGVFAGVYRRIDIAQPAAGAGVVIPVAGGTWWRALTVRLRLTTSAAVANRVPVLSITDGDVPLWSAPAAVTQAASLATVYSWAIGGDTVPGSGAVAGFASGVLPDLILPVGGQLSIAVAAIDAADQIDQVRAYVQQIEGWPQGPMYGRLDEYTHHAQEGYRHHA